MHGDGSPCIIFSLPLDVMCSRISPREKYFLQQNTFAKVQNFSHISKFSNTFLLPPCQLATSSLLLFSFFLCSLPVTPVYPVLPPLQPLRALFVYYSRIIFGHSMTLKQQKNIFFLAQSKIIHYLCNVIKQQI